MFISKQFLYLQVLTVVLLPAFFISNKDRMDSCFSVVGEPRKSPKSKDFFGPSLDKDERTAEHYCIQTFCTFQLKSESQRPLRDFIVFKSNSA